jgi:murein DD-endopeptidase MepM/ murein hydrolase activator NlpD
MNYDRQRRAAVEGAVQALGHVAARAAKPLVLGLAKLLLPVLLPLALILLLALFCYAAVFALPRYIMDESPSFGPGKVVAIWTTGEKDDPWTTETDAELARQYRELGDRWKEGLEGRESLLDRLGPDWAEDVASGLVLSEEDQAEPYRLPWSVLAGVDRILGDPYVSRAQDKPGAPPLPVGWSRYPRPEKAYEALRSEFAWKTVTIRKTIYEKTTDESGNETVTSRTVTAAIRLLVEADTYEADYRFRWEPKTVVRGNPGEGSGSVSEVWVLAGAEKKGPYFGRLKEYLASGGIYDPLDVETALRLAMTYDPDYAADLDLLDTVDWAFSEDFSVPRWQGVSSGKALPLPAEYVSRVASPFGMRLHPIYHRWRFHNGVDFAAPEGTPVFAFSSGLVVWAGSMGGYGLAVVIDHGGYKTLYAHLSRVDARPGREVAAGEKIGEVGTTGVSTGPHLHFTVWEVEDGVLRPVDPMSYLR